MRSRIRLNDQNRRWWTLAAMCFALFMIMLDNTVVNVALPSIQRSLGASLSSLEWTVNAYALTFAVVLVTAGRLGDIFGRRRAFLFGVVVFALSSAAIGLAPNDHLIVAGRAIQGIGAGFMMPATLSIITNAFPPAERGKAIGTWAGVSALALAIGPLVGGALTEYVSWRAIFFLNLPVAVGAVAVTLFATRESRDESATHRIDWLGIATLSVGLSTVVLALVEGNSWGWGSGRIVGLLVAAAVALVGFVLAERHMREPMVDFGFFRSRTYVGANAVAFIVSFAMFAVFFFLALYMQNILGYSPVEAGARFLPLTVVLMLTAPVAGRLADRVGPRPLMAIGLGFVSVALFRLTRIGPGTGYGGLVPSFVLIGLGIGLTMSPMSTAAMNAVSQAKAGVASGILSMVRMVGATFGVAALGAVFQHIASNQLAHTLAGAGLSPHQRAEVVHNLGSGATSPAGLPPGAAGQVGHAARDAFIHALASGMWLSTILALVGVIAALLLVEDKRETAPAAGMEPAATAHALSA